MTTFLSSCRMRHPVTDIQRIHGMVRGAVPDGERYLWAQPLPSLVVVQADRQVRLPGTSEWASWPVSTPAAGESVRLSLIASPTRVITAGGRKRRVLLPEGEWPDWLRRKLGDAVALDHVEAARLGGRHGRRGGAGVTIGLAQFDATGTVTDSQALAALQHSGVGPHKGYGSGLLIVSSGEAPA